MSSACAGTGTVTATASARSVRPDKPAKLVPSAVDRTRVHVVTPFRFNGRALAPPQEPLVTGLCRRQSNIVAAATYECSARSKIPGCESGCTYPACWPAPTEDRPVSLVCLLTPIIESSGHAPIDDEIRVHPRNRLPRLSPHANSTAGDPWAFRLSTGEQCVGLGRTGPAHTRRIELAYACGGRLIPEPGGLNRARKLWTIRLASSIGQSSSGRYPLLGRVTDAWFAVD